jgi:hypothetical protein
MITGLAAGLVAYSRRGVALSPVRPQRLATTG